MNNYYQILILLALLIILNNFFMLRIINFINNIIIKVIFQKDKSISLILYSFNAH